MNIKPTTTTLYAEIYDSGEIRTNNINEDRNIVELLQLGENSTIAEFRYNDPLAQPEVQNLLAPVTATQAVNQTTQETYYEYLNRRRMLIHDAIEFMRVANSSSDAATLNRISNIAASEIEKLFNA